jgi:hypothetical protein
MAVTKEQAKAARPGDIFHYTGWSDCGAGLHRTVNRARVSETFQEDRDCTGRPAWSLPVRYGFHRLVISSVVNGDFHAEADCTVKDQDGLTLVGP